MARGRFGRGRPPWWPEDEVWPPEGASWHRVRRRFLRRIAFLLVFAFGAFVLMSTLWFAAFGGHAGGDREWRGPPIFGFFIVLVVAVFVITRFVRRTATPIADVMEAAARLAAGDYTTRVTPSGSSEMRELAVAFNEMAEGLQSNEQQLRDLLADVAHELRTPLSVIRGNAEGMVDGLYAADREHLQPIIEEAGVMARLLQDLATLSTAEAGMLSLHRETVAAAALVDESVASFAPRAEEAEVQLQRRLAPALPSLDVDPVRIREVLGNLLSNALRHTPPAAP
jgi:signal transduction histidine kinase